MAKKKRKIIEIDEEKCNGCGECVIGCPEGALQIIDGKAKLVKENFCDGLGACIGDCPVDALNIIESDVEEYDEGGVIEHIKKTKPHALSSHLQHIEEHQDELARQGIDVSEYLKKEKPFFSELSQWPIQLHLVSPEAPYFKDSNLVIAADCVPYAYANFHKDFLKDNSIAIACPKLDDTASYVTKLSQIFKSASPKSIKIVTMEVPCCFGLVQVVKEAISKSGVTIPTKEVVVSVSGDLKR